MDAMDSIHVVLRAVADHGCLDWASCSRSLASVCRSSRTVVSGSTSRLVIDRSLTNANEDIQDIQDIPEMDHLMSAGARPKELVISGCAAEHPAMTLRRLSKWSGTVLSAVTTLLIQSSDAPLYVCSKTAASAIACCPEISNVKFECLTKFVAVHAALSSFPSCKVSVRSYAPGVMHHNASRTACDCCLERFDVECASAGDLEASFGEFVAWNSCGSDGCGIVSLSQQAHCIVPPGEAFRTLARVDIPDVDVYPVQLARLIVGAQRLKSIAVRSVVVAPGFAASCVDTAVALICADPNPHPLERLSIATRLPLVAGLCSVRRVLEAVGNHPRIELACYVSLWIDNCSPADLLDAIGLLSDRGSPAEAGVAPEICIGFFNDPGASAEAETAEVALGRISYDFPWTVVLVGWRHIGRRVSLAIAESPARYLVIGPWCAVWPDGGIGVGPVTTPQTSVYAQYSTGVSVAPTIVPVGISLESLHVFCEVGRLRSTRVPKLKVVKILATSADGDAIVSRRCAAAWQVSTCRATFIVLGGAIQDATAAIGVVEEIDGWSTHGVPEEVAMSEQTPPGPTFAIRSGAALERYMVRTRAGKDAVAGFGSAIHAMCVHAAHPVGGSSKRTCAECLLAAPPAVIDDIVEALLHACDVAAELSRAFDCSAASDEHLCQHTAELFAGHLLRDAAVLSLGDCNKLVAAGELWNANTLSPVASRCGGEAAASFVLHACTLGHRLSCGASGVFQRHNDECEGDGDYVKLCWSVGGRMIRLCAIVRQAVRRANNAIGDAAAFERAMGACVRSIAADVTRHVFSSACDFLSRTHNAGSHYIFQSPSLIHMVSTLTESGSNAAVQEFGEHVADAMSRPLDRNLQVALVVLGRKIGALTVSTLISAATSGHSLDDVMLPLLTTFFCEGTL